MNGQSLTFLNGKKSSLGQSKGNQRLVRIGIYNINYNLCAAAATTGRSFIELVSWSS